MERDNDSAAPLREMNALREETKILCGKELCKINVAGSEGDFILQPCFAAVFSVLESRGGDANL